MREVLYRLLNKPIRRKGFFKQDSIHQARMPMESSSMVDRLQSYDARVNVYKNATESKGLTIRPLKVYTSTRHIIKSRLCNLLFPAIVLSKNRRAKPWRVPSLFGSIATKS